MMGWIKKLCGAFSVSGSGWRIGDPVWYNENGGTGEWKAGYYRGECRRFSYLVSETPDSSVTVACHFRNVSPRTVNEKTP
jgi:hypothetical protein